MEEGELEVPQLTDEQVARGCKVDGGRIICPPESNVSVKPQGMTDISLGAQKIKSVRCIENKKSGDLECTVTSKAKQ